MKLIWQTNPQLSRSQSTAGRKVANDAGRWCPLSDSQLSLRPAAPALLSVWWHEPIKPPTGTPVEHGTQVITTQLITQLLRMQDCFRDGLQPVLVHRLDLLYAPFICENQGEIFGASVLYGLSFIHMPMLEAARPFCGSFQSDTGHQHVPKGTNVLPTPTFIFLFLLRDRILILFKASIHLSKYHFLSPVLSSGQWNIKNCMLLLGLSLFFFF